MESVFAKRALVMTVLLVFFVMVPMVSAQPRLAATDSICILDAYYGDLDADSYEDDIKILVEFSFTLTYPSRVDMSLWIELPSGTTYNVRVSIYRAPSQSILNIDCIDMAKESGWYTVTMLASIMGTGGGKYFIIDTIEFDPPTGTGSGMPTVTAYF